VRSRNVARAARRTERPSDGVRVLVEVLFGTGARISEILALDRCDVDAGEERSRSLGKETSSAYSSSPTERWSGLNAISVVAR
jgi:site-specific recombinase XerD